MRPLLTLLLAGLAVLAAIGPAGADAAAAVDDRARAEADRLSAHPEWRRLLHHREGWQAGSRSQADDPDFFLAADGDRNPQAELVATLDAFRAPAESGDGHAQCRFVARLRWLRERLDLGELPAPDCAAWRTFRDQVQATRAVLVFPSYYLNSPSSMFGHTLLRLDRGTDGGGSEYLSYAVNFGALVTPGDNSLFYAFKGLAGGYSGQFAVDQYYKKIREYNRDENRDIWEYPLNLDAAETTRLVEHLWELRGIDFAYYFFDENCSFRLLELLEVARPGLDLTGDFPLTAIPIDTVRAVQRAALVDGPAQFRPSQGTALRQRLATIPDDLEPLAQRLARDTTDSGPALAALPAATRAAVLDAAYRHLRFVETGEARDPAAAERSFGLLRALNAEAAALPAPGALPEHAIPPDRSHGSRRLTVGGRAEDGREFATIGLRLSLHSLEDNRDGFPLGAQINLGNLDLRVRDDGRVDVQRFDVVDILSLSPRDRFFRPWSWSVLTGVERQWTDGLERRVVHVSGGGGVTRALGDRTRLYGLGTLRLEYNTGFRDPVQPALGLRAGLLSGLGPLTWRGEATAEQFANGERRLGLGLSQTLRLARQHALQAEVLWRDQAPEAQLAVGLRYLFHY
jgi:plasmid stabilization system protein ParE